MKTYWGKELYLELLSIEPYFTRRNFFYLLIVVSITTLLQMANLPLLNLLVTAPITICIIIHPLLGTAVYFFVSLLLFFLQPGNLLVFMFATGLAGLSVGCGYQLVRTRIVIVSIGACVLATGIEILLFRFHVPVLGSLSSQKDEVFPILVLISFLYSWIWTEIIRVIVKNLAAFKK
ncbi:hypothetical protein [Bacillus sp. 165]|uniref:hypothetical protein n=1 Tax=Bacillus sp. 165 TaxID=1529117 RepID=UPI001ADD169F|nr:hypothetical protein [Bacillus sp. 165]MBO9129081.1 hypothetical protein [Bacillus sp. 165]